MLTIISPDWPAPENIHACTTTRQGGTSQYPYASFNVGDHVGDDIRAVTTHRELLKNTLPLPTDPFWIQQVHGTQIVQINSQQYNHAILPIADGSFTYLPNKVCAILTADCLPVLFCDRRGTVVAAIHAGWRGLAAGIIEEAVNAMKTPANDLLAWLGPAIGPEAFEVGEEVREQFINFFPDSANAFQPSPNKRWLANLYFLARQHLLHCGVTKIYGGNFCTYTDKQRFYSYRRDGVTGRMASLIWLSEYYN